jgi:hypothetical protein
MHSVHYLMNEFIQDYLDAQNHSCMLLLLGRIM